jgi:hypothetical protein
VRALRGETPSSAVVGLPRKYDDAVLSHADRSRCHAEGRRPGGVSGVTGSPHGAVLHDGMVCGMWHLDRDRGTSAATLVVPPPAAQEAGARRQAVVSCGSRSKYAIMSSEVVTWA